MEKQNEIWLPIKGAEEMYQVSNLGRIKNIKFRFGGEWILKNKVTKANYHYVALTNYKGNKKTTNIGVSKLVAEAFISNPMDYMEVRHKDGNKANNTVENLEWVDDSKNNRKASGYVYRVWHSNTPENVVEFKCQYDVEFYIKEKRGLKTIPNINYHITHHKGSPDRFGYCVERIKLSKTEFENERNTK